MPTIVSQSTLDELGRLLDDACEKGDNVSAIAERTGLNRSMVSQIRNRTYPRSPTLETVETLLKAIGCEITVSKARANNRHT